MRVRTYVRPTDSYKRKLSFSVCVHNELFCSMFITVQSKGKFLCYSLTVKILPYSVFIVKPRAKSKHLHDTPGGPLSTRTARCVDRTTVKYVNKIARVLEASRFHDQTPV